MEDQHPSASNTRDTEDEGEDHHQYFDGRRIHRVPHVMRFKKHSEEDPYAPKIVSFGPYYHGVKELGMAEMLKHIVLADFVSSSGKDREIFYRPIFKVIDKIRNCYVGVSRDAYDDEALAEMMLLDSSFAIYLMKICVRDYKKYVHFCKHLGMASLTFAFQDMILLENQIPLWVIKLLTKLIYGKRGPMLICNFASEASFGVSKLTRIPGEDTRQPLHLLDVNHRIYVQELDNAGGELVEKLDNAAEELVEELDNAGEQLVEELENAEKMPVGKCLWWPWRKQNQYEVENYDNRQSRSVTDLKAKGIHFGPSSYCLKNIKFKSYKFYGQLQLPVWYFTINSKPFFTQMIAYEASPESDIDNIIISYVNFLKSLVVKPEDVKELREKKILYSTLDSDEQIVKLIKEIDNYGLEDDSIFDDVKRRIEEHCSSKAKTLVAELINSYFRSPWNFIALLAATFLLCLTFLQTYYTINPTK